MSEFNIDPLAAAMRKLRADINRALGEFDQATGGAVAVDISATAVEVTTVADPVRRYQHMADVRTGSLEFL